MTLNPTRFVLPVLALAFAATASAMVGHAIDPGRLPLCTLPGDAGQGACRLPVENGDFSRLPQGDRSVPYWVAHGLAGIGHEPGNAYAILNRSERIQQVVRSGTLVAPSANAYALHFRYRVTAGEVAVNARLSLSDRDGFEQEMLGETTLTGAPGAWHDAELVVAGKAWAGEKNVLVDIGNLSPYGMGIVDIDDVYLVAAPIAGR
ncbi:MAG: hypothetical protein ABWX83_00025 [Luteibacter sp.]